MVKKSSVPPEATKLFILDTNILMHDPTCIFRFKEHDVYVPMCVLEELDNHKKGTTEVARNVRQAIRFLRDLIARPGVSFTKEIPLSLGVDPTAPGKLFFQTTKERQDNSSDDPID